jgi:hypothetical protein
VSGNTQGQVWEASAPSGAEAHLLPELGTSKGVTEHKTQCDFLFFCFFLWYPLGIVGKTMQGISESELPSI